MYAVGVLVLGWAVFDVLLLFLVEIVFLGVFGLVRLLMARAGTRAQHLGLLAFYVTGFGLMTLGLAVMIFVAFRRPTADPPISFAVVFHDLRQPGVLLAAAVLFGFLLRDFITGWILPGRWRTASAMWELRHVVIRQPALVVGVMIAAIVLKEQGNPLPGLFVVILLKTAAEMYYAWQETPVPAAG